jgi:hypothetical protein
MIGKCPEITTTEGTFCTVTGTELRGVEYKCYDFRACCTPVHVPKTKALASHRKQTSLSRCRAVAFGFAALETAATQLFFENSALRNKAAQVVRQRSLNATRKRLGNLSQFKQLSAAIREISKRPSFGTGAAKTLVSAAAADLWNIAQALRLNRNTYSSLAAFPLLFVATITSKSPEELDELCKRLNLAPTTSLRTMAHTYAIPDTQYPLFGLSCRAMSKMWREIKVAANSNNAF